MKPGASSLLTLIALAACHREVDPSRSPDSAAAPTALPTAAQPSVASDDQPVPEGFCHPARVVSTGRGGAIFDACFDPQTNRTDLVAQRFDADAMAVGTRVRLRRVPGNVLSLAAVADGETLRVAWISHVGEGAERNDESADHGGGARDLAVLSVRLSLEAIGEPVAVNHHAAPLRSEMSGRGWARSRVELAAGPDGALLVLATDAEEPCPQGGQRCATWSVFSVDAGGTSRRVRHESTGTPSLEPQSLVRAGDDFAYVRGADAVRNILYVQSLRAPGSSVSTLPAATFDPLPDWTNGALAWTGTALVALGEERSLDAAEPRAVVRVTTTAGRSPTRSRPGDDPDTVRWPRVTDRSWKCLHGHPVVHLGWPGGSLDLDPTAPGASINLSRWVPAAVAGLAARANAGAWSPPMAWMGRALLALDGHDQLHRWTCGRDGTPPTE